MADSDSAAVRLRARGGEAALGVDFRQQGDRIAHRVIVVDADGEHAVLESLEGAGDQPWPPSPALQALNRDQLLAAGAGANVAAALVGMSGRSHWSLGIEPETRDGRPALLFDAACRVKQSAAATVGSTYRVLVDAQQPDSATLRLSTPAGVLQLTALPAMAGAAMPALELNGAACLIASPAADDVTPPVTLRWRYRVELLHR